MTIVKSVVDKAVVGFVAAAMVFSMFAPAAQAQSTEDLQKMIDDLMKQVAALKGGSTPATGGSSASVCPYTWTRDLKTGAMGADVKALQQFLNASADTRVAATGPGSMGMETEFFGPATAAAVSKMQVMYRADILTPAGLVNPTGFFGPSSRAKANSLCTAAPSTGGDEDEDEDMNEDEDEDMELSGEADLDSVEVDDADQTDVQEGEDDVVIGTLTVEFTDGDAEISRVDVALDHATGTPWDAFETVSLWVDGEMIAEVDASDEDEYLNEDAGSLRFSGLDIVAMEDEELEIAIGATIQNNLDADERGDWDLNVLSMRFFDASGVAETDSSTGDLGTGSSKAAEFVIEEAGEGEELKFSLASDNPDSTDIIVDEDSVTNDVTILTYNIEAEEGDIELDRLVVRVETTGASTTNVVNDIELVVDGQTFRDEALGTLATGKSQVDGNAIWYLFDIDGDVTIEEDEEIDVEVVVDLKRRAAGTYANGQSIKASVDSTERAQTVAEGADDLTSGDFSGSAVGDRHTLVASGIVVPVDGFSSSIKTLGTNSTVGEFTLEFDVTAVEGNYYIAQVASSAALTSGVRYVVEGTVGTGSVTATLDSSADETSDVFIVREGETETFTLKVTIDPQNSGSFKVGLTGVNWSADTNGVNDGSGGEDDLYVPSPAQDFDSDTQTITGS